MTDDDRIALIKARIAAATKARIADEKRLAAERTAAARAAQLERNSRDPRIPSVDSPWRHQRVFRSR